MKDTLIKGMAYVSTGSIVFSGVGAVIGQSVFAGQIDKKLDLSSLRRDVRSRSNSFVYAVFSDLKAYLVSQGKMTSDESLYDKYKDSMINKLKEYIKRYNEEHLGGGYS